MSFGLSRTYQKSRLFPGLTVENNLYLGIVGRKGGHLRPIRTSRDVEYRRRAREAAERVWLGGQLSTLVGSLSHGEQRQLEIGMASVVEPSIMMLDEPASGLSRGEREKLTELLLALPSDVTLILIEHDMDVALTVARNVTVMHEGGTVVEGTPAEIRASELVHEIYLGSGYHNE
jgi:branched-chain amino acid transport system ATP-binding protein